MIIFSRKILVSGKVLPLFIVNEKTEDQNTYLLGFGQIKRTFSQKKSQIRTLILTNGYIVWFSHSPHVKIISSDLNRKLDFLLEGKVDLLNKEKILLMTKKKLIKKRI